MSKHKNDESKEHKPNKKRKIQTNVRTAPNQRSHHAIIKHVLEQEKKGFSKKVEEERRILQKDVADSAKRLMMLFYRSNVSLGAYRCAQLEHAKLEDRLAKLDMEETRWQQQREILQYDTLSTLIQTNRLLKRSPEHFYIDNDHCPKCNTAFVFESLPSLYKCKVCTRIYTALFVPEDMSVDKLGTAIEEEEEEEEEEGKDAKKQEPQERKDYHTDDRNVVPRAKKQLKKKPQQSKHKEQTQLAKREMHNEDAIKEFTLYLKQFEISAPKIPNDVLNKLTAHLAITRINGYPRVTNAAVRTVLQQFPDLAIYMQYIDLIINIYNNAPIPQLSSQVIERMTQLYRSLRSVSSQHDDKKKVFAQSVLAASLLHALQETEQALKFGLAKTRSVMSETNHRLCVLIHEASRKDPDIWRGLKPSPLF